MMGTQKCFPSVPLLWKGLAMYGGMICREALMHSGVAEIVEPGSDAWYERGTLYEGA